MSDRYPAIVITDDAGSVQDWKWLTRASGQLQNKAAVRGAVLHYLAGVYEQTGKWLYPTALGRQMVYFISALPIDIDHPTPGDRRVIELAASTIGEPVFSIEAAPAPVQPATEAETLFLQCVRRHWQTEDWKAPAIVLEKGDLWPDAPLPAGIDEALAAVGMAVSPEPWPEANFRFLDLCGDLGMDRFVILQGLTSMARRIGIFSGKEYAE